MLLYTFLKMIRIDGGSLGPDNKRIWDIIRENQEFVIDGDIPNFAVFSWKHNYIPALAKALSMGNVVTNMCLMGGGRSCNFTPLLLAMKNNMMFTELRIDSIKLEDTSAFFNALAELRFIQHLYIQIDPSSNDMGDRKSRRFWRRCVWCVYHRLPLCFCLIDLQGRL